MSLSAQALVKPLTFSAITIGGRSASIASHIRAHNPERVAAPMPLRAPAWDTSWHGKPPVKMSTGGTVDQSTADTSPRLGTPG